MNQLTIPAYSEQAARRRGNGSTVSPRFPEASAGLRNWRSGLPASQDGNAPPFHGNPWFCSPLITTSPGRGVSATGQEVTTIQVRNFLRGGGTINAFCP